MGVAVGRSGGVACGEHFAQGVGVGLGVTVGVGVTVQVGVGEAGGVGVWALTVEAVLRLTSTNRKHPTIESRHRSVCGSAGALERWSAVLGVHGVIMASQKLSVTLFFAASASGSIPSPNERPSGRALSSRAAQTERISPLQSVSSLR